MEYYVQTLVMELTDRITLLPLDMLVTANFDSGYQAREDCSLNSDYILVHLVKSKRYVDLILLTQDFNTSCIKSHETLTSGTTFQSPESTNPLGR